jgi:hypothetical protein
LSSVIVFSHERKDGRALGNEYLDRTAEPDLGRE